MNQVWLIAKGCATYIPFLWRHHQSSAQKFPACYYYGIWLRHLVFLHKAGMKKIPRAIAEVGPGDSLGTGLAALLCGSQSLYALDALSNITKERNLKILDRLVELFTARTPIPDEKEFPQMLPKLKNYAFPRQILTDQLLSRSLNPNRLMAIKKALRGQKSTIVIKHLIGWGKKSLPRASADLVLSQAVMEHVENIDSSYHSFYAFLKKGGFSSHTIDFRCHGLTYLWDGHRGFSPIMWKLIKGKRQYLLNRSVLSTHLQAATRSGFRLINAKIYRRRSQTKNIKIPHLRSDLDAAEAFIILKK